MATTINPAVSRVTAAQWFLHLGLFVFGLAVGATVACVAVVAVAAGVEAVAGLAAWAVVAALVIAVAVARDLGVNAPVPYRDVQVPQVLRYLVPPSLLALAFGAHLGTGFLTRFTYSSHTAFMVTLPLVITDPLVVATTILLFAAGKAMVLVAFHRRSPEEVALISERHPGWATYGRQAMRLANGSFSALVLLSALRLGGVI
jgi:hypothetical protein